MRKLTLLFAVIFLGFNLAFAQVDYMQQAEISQQIEMSQQMEIYQQQIDVYQQIESQHTLSTDGFFTTNYQEYRDVDAWNLPMLPSSHGSNSDQSAPVGSGLLLLAGMGLAYGIRRKND